MSPLARNQKIAKAAAPHPPLRALRSSPPRHPRSGKRCTWHGGLARLRARSWVAERCSASSPFSPSPFHIWLRSNRVQSQLDGDTEAALSIKGVELLTIALSMTRSFRIHAVSAIFGDFPALRNRSWKLRIDGFRRSPTSVAMYKISRTSPRPPQIERFPLNRPLSRLNGATPTKAAIFFRSRLPSSGKRASVVPII
jgi:hypothetical protein